MDGRGRLALVVAAAAIAAVALVLIEGRAGRVVLGVALLAVGAALVWFGREPRS